MPCEGMDSGLLEAPTCTTSCASCTHAGIAQPEKTEPFISLVLLDDGSIQNQAK